MEGMKNVLVSANPGSGKTFSLSMEVAKSIDAGEDPANILCLTFTKKARDNMEESIRKHVDNSIKIPEVMTFHSFANSVIVQRRGSSDPIPERLLRYQIMRSLRDRNVMNYDTSVLMNDYPSIINISQITGAIRFLKSFGVLPPAIDVSAMKSYIKDMYGRGMGVTGYSREEMVTLAGSFVDIFSDYEKSKIKGELDYNDQILQAIDIVKKYARKYRIVFIDEVQDMSGIEYELVKQVADVIYAVGDMKQAIFGFQGGDIKSLLKMKEERDVEEQFMEGTRRLCQNVMEYCRNFYTSTTKQALSDDILKFNTIKEGKPHLGILKCKDKNEIPDAVFLQLSRLDKSESVGIIVRTNSQANQISDYLSDKKIRHHKVSGSKGNLDWRKDMADFVAGIYGGQPEIISMLYSRFSGVELKDAVEIVDRMRFAKNPTEFLPEHINDCRKIYGKNLMGLKKLFYEYIIPASIRFGQPCLEAATEVYNSLPFFIERVKNGEDISLREITDYILQENNYEGVDEIDERISVITVHKAKGLEFDDVIYVPTVQKKRSISAIDMITGSITSQIGVDYGVEQRMDEECRIDFVGITRTKGSLTVVCVDDNLSRYNFEPITVVNFQPERKVNEFISLKEMLEESVNRKEEEPWLIKFMERKFSKLNKLSYSMLQKTEKLQDFAESYILGIQFRSTALTFGTNIHTFIEEFIKNHSSPTLLTDDKEIKTWSNFVAYDRYIRDELKGSWEGSELVMKKRVDEVFPDMKSDLTIEGRIDGVYNYETPQGKRTVIVDFKTSKKPDQNYVIQLSLYGKLYALAKGVDSKSVESEISYLSLRDTKVNLGVYERKWDKFEPVIMERGLEKVKELVSRFSQYKASIDIFVGDIMQLKSGENRLIKEMQDVLKRETEKLNR